MIVKLIIHKKQDAISVWNKDGDRLFYSDKPNDIKTAHELLLVRLAPTDTEIARMKMGEQLAPVFDQKHVGYFKAYWKNKIVQLVGRSEGHTW